MKVLLRNIDNGEFLGVHGDWTKEPQLAQDFREVPLAVDFALGAGLTNVQVSLYDVGTACEVKLPAMEMDRAAA